MKKRAPIIREEVFRFVKYMGSAGATCDEAEADLFLSHQTCSARFNELWRRGRIVDSGQRRPTRSGRKAIVFVVRDQ